MVSAMLPTDQGLDIKFCVRVLTSNRFEVDVVKRSLINSNISDHHLPSQARESRALTSKCGSESGANLAQ